MTIRPADASLMPLPPLVPVGRATAAWQVVSIEPSPPPGRTARPPALSYAHGGHGVSAAARPALVLKVLAVSALALGAFFAGMLAERLRFDFQRSDMLRRYDQALREHQGQIIQTEKQSGDARPRPAR
jgi:hypothetical protein